MAGAKTLHPHRSATSLIVQASRNDKPHAVKTNASIGCSCPRRISVRCGACATSSSATPPATSSSPPAAPCCIRAATLTVSPRAVKSHRLANIAHVGDAGMNGRAQLEPRPLPAEISVAREALRMLCAAGN